METKKLIIFLDSGDTIVDERTEIRDGEIVVRAEVIPGADVMVRTLAQRGYTLVLVADGLMRSFQNVLTQHGLYDCFSAIITSENVGACKPSPRMFKAAAGAMDLDADDYGRIIMVGNNLSRDVKGANQMGIPSVWMNWTARYPRTPADETEQPCYTIGTPLELLDLAEELNEALEKQEVK